MEISSDVICNLSSEKAMTGRVLNLNSAVLESAIFKTKNSACSVSAAWISPNGGGKAAEQSKAQNSLSHVDNLFRGKINCISILYVNIVLSFVSPSYILTNVK